MRVVLLFGFIGAACAQTISVTAPSANQTISGTSFILTNTCTACTSLYAVEYDVDGEAVGIARTPPYMLDWDPYYAANGVHTVAAIARDVMNVVIATSTQVSFSVENDLPQHTCPPNGTACTDMTVTIGEVAKILYKANVSWINNVVSFHGANAVTTVRNPQIRNGLASSPYSFPSFSSARGHLIAVFARVQSTSQTVSCADNKGNSYTSLNVQVGNSFSGQWCYAKNITGGADHVITLTSSAGAHVLGYVFEIAGADAASPLDVNSNNGSSGGVHPNDTNIYSAPYSLAFSAANEIVLAGATWGGVSFTPSAGPGGWAFYNDTSLQSAVEVINPPATWYGTVALSPTVRGDNSGISKTFQVNVDGLLVSANGTSNARAEIVLDTSLFTNSSHAVVLSALGGNCPGCQQGTWNFLGQWEQQQTFTNGVSPTELRSNFRDMTLCVTPSINCPSSITLAGSIYNSDGSSTADASTFASADTTCATVTSSGGVVTAIGSNCSTNITLTSANGGFTRTVYVMVPPSGNKVPHFNCTTGAILTTYTPGQSCWESILYSGSIGFAPVSDSSFNYAAQYGPALKTAFNTIMWPMPALTVTEAAFDANANSDASRLLGYMNEFGLNCFLQGFSVTQSTPTIFNLMYGIGQAYATPALTYYLNRLSGRCANMILADEVTSKLPGNPLLGTDGSGLVIGTNGFSQIACTTGATCTVTWPNWSVAANGDFIIVGSGDPNLDYNTTSGAPPTLHATRIDSSHFTFPTPAGVGNTTYTSTTNPGLRIEYFVAWTYDAAATAVDNVSSTAHTCPGGGGGGNSAGPCPNYIHYDVVKRMLATITAANNYPQFTWPSLAGVFGFSVSNWCGKNSVAGVRAGTYCLGYWSNGATYLGQYQNLSSLLAGSSTGEGFSIRTIRQNMDLGTPLIMETAGTTSDYTFMGNLFNVVSCSGNTITTSSPHNVTTIYWDLTRMTVTGSAGGACDGNYYIIAAPTATTLSVALANATFSGTGNSGTITFSNGDTWPNNYVTSNASGNHEGVFQGTNIGNCPNTWRNHRGMTFTVSGSTNASVNSMTGVFMMDTTNPCSTNLNYWRQLPNLSSTGGTAIIVRDHYLQRGEKWEINSEAGPRIMFASDLLPFIAGAAGGLAYAYGLDPQLFDLNRAGNNGYGSQTGRDNFPPQTNFNGGGFNQGQINPLQDFAKSQAGWVAHTHANALASRLISYAYGQRLPAPDYGQFFEASATRSSVGNLLMIQSFADNSVSCKANLAPYLVAGQSIIRISATWSGIEPVLTLPPGTTSDTMSCQPGEFRAYLFPRNAAAEVQQPTISARLADVPNATKVAVQFSYNLLALTSPSTISQVLFQTVDCGSGSCLLPLDRQIGTVYYRLVYLDASSRVLATSDIQIL